MKRHCSPILDTYSNVFNSQACLQWDYHLLPCWRQDGSKCWYQTIWNVLDSASLVVDCTLTVGKIFLSPYKMVVDSINPPPHYTKARAVMHKAQFTQYALTHVHNICVVKTARLHDLLCRCVFCIICIRYPAISHIYTCSDNGRIGDLSSYSINYYDWRLSPISKKQTKKKGLLDKVMHLRCIKLNH